MTKDKEGSNGIFVTDAVNYLNLFKYLRETFTGKC